MNIISFVKAVKRHYEVQNLLRQGCTTNRHIVVFESDDWGSVRMPSLEVRERLLRNGVVLQSPSSYDKVDTLASEQDLTFLMEVLDSVRDSRGNPAVITFDTIVANPDFKRIKQSGYTEYYYEPFTSTLKKYPGREQCF